MSRITLNTTFKINTPIIDATFNIEPINNAIIIDNIKNQYQYPLTLSFIIKMKSGSNVDIEIDTGDICVFDTNTNTYKNNVLNINTIGNWFDNINDPSTSSYIISYTYVNPGDYLINVKLSNSLSIYKYSKSIQIISKVDDLNIDLFDGLNYVLYKINSQNGLAQFRFKYNSASTKSGSHSQVTFYPGDSTNSSFGPFLLGMDFNLNINKISLSYEYKLAGIYTASFIVSNILGSKIYNLLVNVVESIDGFYIDVNPSYAQPNEIVKISAYMVQGNNVQLKWLIYGTQVNSALRRCKKFFLIF